MRRFLIFSCIFCGLIATGLAQSFVHEPLSTVQSEKCTRDLFEIESTYTFSSDFHDSRLGEGSSAYYDFSYDHRFRVEGNWYLRFGAEYERFDFGGTNNGLPDHLQAIVGHIAFEYVVHDYAAAGIRLQPGFYFQDRLRGQAFDIPWKLFVGFPLKKDKVFAFVGLGGGLYQDPPVGPGGGIVWLINDKLRLEGVFPKPALVYDPNDTWQFRIVGDIVAESFRTDDVVTPKFELHHAVLQYEEFRAGVEASYSGIKGVKINAGAGCTFLREFDFFRAERTEKSDPAPYARLSIEAKF